MRRQAMQHLWVPLFPTFTRTFDPDSGWPRLHSVLAALIAGGPALFSTELTRGVTALRCAGFTQAGVRHLWSMYSPLGIRPCVIS